MANIEYTRTVATPAGLFGSAFANISNAFTAWKSARDTRSALSQLSDRELDDIGLTRGDIERVAHYG